MKCQFGGNPATVHTTDIDRESHTKRPLCDAHAREQLGLALPPFSITRLDPAALGRLLDALREGATSTEPAHWFRSGRAVPALIGLLQDSETCLRYYAAEWLGQIRSAAKETVLALQQALKDEDEYVRRAVEDALRRSESKTDHEPRLPDP